MDNDSLIGGRKIIKLFGVVLWDAVQRDLDKCIAERRGENAYFPLLVLQGFLSCKGKHMRVC